MSLSDPNYEFVLSANPHAWLICASNLHDQAVQLRNRAGRSTLSLIDREDRIVLSRDGTNKSVFLLAGFAMENAIKSFLVFENPSWISNGAISSRLRSHSLTTLEQASARIPLKDRSRPVLQRLEDGLESWARYPCALSMAATADEDIMTSELWAGYRSLLEAYTGEMVSLLGKLWKGPHKFRRTLDIRRGFLRHG
jgi:hypothetical protein